MDRELYLRKFDELRIQAEKRLAEGLAQPDVAPVIDIKGLQHEVQVQQVELEMQHDELLKAHHELGELRLLAEREREHYRKLFNLAPVGLLVLDSKGVIKECNQAFARMVGQGAEALPGRTLAEFVQQQDRMNFDVLYKQEIKHSVGRKIRFRLNDKGEQTTPVLLSVVAVEPGAEVQKEYLLSLVEAHDE